MPRRVADGHDRPQRGVREPPDGRGDGEGVRQREHSASDRQPEALGGCAQRLSSDEPGPRRIRVRIRRRGCLLPQRSREVCPR